MIQLRLLVLAVVLYTGGRAWADDWPQWRGPGRTGVSKEKGLLKSWPPRGPKLVWTFRDAGRGYSSMAVVGDRLYTMGGPFNDDKECVYALDLNQGKKLWSVEVGKYFTSGWSGPRSTPTVDGNLLYAIGGYGDLVCVDVSSGKKVWSIDMKKDLNGLSYHYGCSESPLIDGDLLIATPGGKKGTMAAFDKKNGQVKWRSTECTYATAYASTIVVESGGVRQYVQVPNAEASGYRPRDYEVLLGVRASDGKLLWKFPVPKTVATPVFHKDCVYVSSMVGCWAVKLERDGGKFKTEQIYTNELMKNHMGSVVLIGNHLYGYTSGYWAEGGIMCQDFQTGVPVWTAKSRGSGSLLYADGNLYCYGDKGDVALIEATPTACKPQGQFRIPEKYQAHRGKGDFFTAPVVANGKLYLRAHELIFCYDVRRPAQ